MAYGVKYRVEFKDFYDTAIKVDILQESYSGSVTSIDPAYPSLSIEWPSRRGKIFDPVRGAIARLNVFASSVNQFEEFFDAYETEYEMRIYKSGSVYWKGWVMVGDHQEVFNSAPYVVAFKAYDLGYLQGIGYDQTREDDDSIIDVIQYCLAQTGFLLNVKERVNLYEDSINSTQSDSVFNQINVHQSVFFDRDWNALSCYEILQRELKPFTAFIMQENGVWNICRIGDMRYTHNYRIFNTAGSVSSSGSEDNTKTLTDYEIINNSGIVLADMSWKNLNLFQNLGAKNLVDNGTFGLASFTFTDFWSVTGGNSYSVVSDMGIFGISEPATGNALQVVFTSGQNVFTHDKTYSVEASNAVNLLIRYRFLANYSGGTGSCIGGFVVRVDTGSLYDVQQDGTWVIGSTDTDNYPCPVRTWVSGEIVTDQIPGTGTLTIFIKECGGLSGPTFLTTYWDYIEVIPLVNSKTTETVDYSEVLDSDNLTEPEDVTIYHGDSEYTLTGAELHLGSYELTGGTATDGWQTKTGSQVEKIMELLAKVYKAQHITTSKRLQATIKGQLEYLDILTNDSKHYLPSSLTYNVDDSEWVGERIEMKYGLETNLVTSIANDPLSTGNPYDVFSSVANTCTIEKTQVINPAVAGTNTMSITSGVRYKLTANLVDNATSNIPSISFGGDTKSDLALGDNEWDVLSSVTSATHRSIITNQIADTCDLTITLTIQEYYGL
jgi:hypothetical protein